MSNKKEKTATTCKNVDKTLSGNQICDIIKMCAEAGVAHFSAYGVEVDFVRVESEKNEIPVTVPEEITVPEPVIHAQDDIEEEAEEIDAEEEAKQDLDELLIQNPDEYFKKLEEMRSLEDGKVD